MDELLLLEAGSIDELLGSAAEDLAAEPAYKQVPAPDFTGSLDYIDSLASRSSVSISQRDLATIATAGSTFDYLSPLINKAVLGPTDRSFSVSTDMRPLQDARLFDPQRSTRRFTGLVRSASDIVANTQDRIATPEHPYSPWEINEIISSPSYRHANRSPFKFRKPSQTVICLKRRIRRAVMHAAGLAGMTGFRHAKWTYRSRVACL